jgi:hypothetical protein
MFKTNLIILSLFISTNLFAQQRNIYSASAKGLNPSSYRIGIHGLYSITSGRFDNSGAKASLLSEESYSLMEGNISLAYGVGKKLDAFLNARMRQVNSQYSNGTDTIKTSNSGLESFSGGIKYSFVPTQSIQWAVDFIYKQTLYEQKFFTNLSQVPDSDLVLGDAGQEFSIGVHTSYKRKRGHILNSIIRYAAPANDLSDEVNYRFESAWLWQKLGLILGVDGIMSFKRDNFTIDPQNKPLQATGASARFNSINRERLTPFLGVNWAFKKWRLELEGGSTISGVSTDQDQYFKIGMVYETSGVTGEDFKIESFKEYIIDSTVIKVSPRGKFIKIDQGISSDVEKGMKFDIFQTDYFGENILVASGLAYEIKADSAIIKIVKKYKKIKLKKGFAGRGY